MTKHLIVCAIALAAADARADASFRGSGVVGVWAGTTHGETHMRDGSVTHDAVELKLEWRVVFADGHVFRGLPTAGLADLDRAAHQQLARQGPYVGGDWGTWVAKGSGAVAAYGKFTETLVPNAKGLTIDAGSMFGARTFVRVPDITGLVLDGAYIYNSNTEDAYYDEPGCRQIIAFSRDGRFVDKGIFTANCGRPNAVAADAPGAGTYAIRDYTLLLRYDDGRVSRRSIAPTLRAGGTDALFVIGQTWRRRSRPLTSVSFSSGRPAPASPGGPAIEWDHMSFVPPPGAATRTATAISFRDGACESAVFASSAATASPAADFADEWRTIFASQRRESAPVSTAETSPRGLGVRYGAAPVGNTFVTLMVFTGKGRRFSVVLITADHAQALKCLPALAPTLDSLTLRG